MSEESEQNPDPADETERSEQGPEVFGQQVKHRQLSARVPDAVGRGVFSTGAIVLTGGTEFVIDFLVRMARPYQVASRVIVPHAAMMQLIRALEDNIRKYEDRFGSIEAMPKADPNAKRPSIQEVYDDLKLPDEILSGVYANACIIGHSPAEFVLDFVTNFFPRSAVSARLYLSSRQVPQLLKGFQHAAQQLQQRRAQQQQQQQDQYYTQRQEESDKDADDPDRDDPDRDDPDRDDDVRDEDEESR